MLLKPEHLGLVILPIMAGFIMPTDQNLPVIAFVIRFYAFMAKYNIGSSEFGKIMDMAGVEKGVFLHRLYGHHLAYDFPWKNPEHTIDFLAHEFSDLFTKNGLPIIPESS